MTAALLAAHGETHGVQVLIRWGHGWWGLTGYGLFVLTAIAMFLGGIGGRRK